MNNEVTKTNENAIPDFPKLPPEIYFPKGFADEVCPWLDHVIAFFRKWSPRSYEGYFLVAAIFLLAAVANGRVEYEFGGCQTTNIYSILVGKTTVHAKTTLTKLVKRIIKDLGMNHSLPDTVTAPKMLSMMALSLPENFNKMTSEKKTKFLEKMKYPGQRYWISNEFGSIIEDVMNKNSVNSKLRSILRGFDDHENLYENGTIIRDIEEVLDPYLSILGCCTQEDLAPYAKHGTKLWGDGFLARFILVAPPTKDCNKGRFPEEPFNIPPEVIEPLRDWNERLGKPEIKVSPNLIRSPAKGQMMKLDRETIDAYYAYHDALIDLIIDENDDMAGNYGRLANKALRYAVLMASLDGCDEVSIKYWVRAQMIAEEQRESFHYLYYQLTSGKYKKKLSTEEKILARIKKDGKINSRQFQQDTHILRDEARTAFDGLLDKGMICEKSIGNAIWYVFPEKHV